jgi:hypothetical protein
MVRNTTEINSEKQVISKKRLPSRTRISPANSACRGMTLLEATKYSRIGRRLYLAGSPILQWIIQ